jgi:hypothetical protein
MTAGPAVTGESVAAARAAEAALMLAGFRKKAATAEPDLSSSPLIFSALWLDI